MKNILLSITLMVLLSACATTTWITKEQAYPEMYVHTPKTVLVLPASNVSTASDAATLYATTIAEPLAEAGYYVLSVPATDAIFQAEGITDGAQLEQFDPKRAKELFGADAVLYVKINRWDTNYYLTAGNVTVAANFRMVSSETGKELWNYKDTVVIDTSSNSGNLIADLIVTAITTATTDYVPIARKVNYRVMQTVPVGPYHKQHNMDKAVQVVSVDKLSQL
jgi:hypothetical protein